MRCWDCIFRVSLLKKMWNAASRLNFCDWRQRVGALEQEGWRVRKDGSRFWADAVITAIRDVSGELIGYAKVTRDFTDRKRAEEAVMLQLSGALLANMDVRKLLDAISASHARGGFRHDAATLGLYDAATGALMVQFLGADEGSARRGDVRLPVEGSPSGLAFRKGEPVVLDRIGTPHFRRNRCGI